MEQWHWIRANVDLMSLLMGRYLTIHGPVILGRCFEGFRDFKEKLL